MVKGKLYLLLSALSLGKEIRVDRDKTTVDELFKELQEIAHQMPKTIAMASQGGGAPGASNSHYNRRPDGDRTPEQPESRQSTIDHSRLPPEVAAVLARTPRTIGSGAPAPTSYESNHAPLRQSPRGVRSRSRERSLNNVMNASAALANEVATDFVERGRFDERAKPRA